MAVAAATTAAAAAAAAAPAATAMPAAVAAPAAASVPVAAAAAATAAVASRGCGRWHRCHVYYSIYKAYLSQGITVEAHTAPTDFSMTVNGSLFSNRIPSFC